MALRIIFATIMCAALGAALPATSPEVFFPGQLNSTAPTTKKLLIGAPGQISVASYNGIEFAIESTLSMPGANPSWILFTEPNHVYSVDENSATLHQFNLDLTTSKLAEVQSSNGSSGVVHLEFNKNKTRMVGSAYGAGTIDIWDVSQRETAPRHMKTIPNTELGPGSHPHQAVLDPSGRFMAVNDLGTNKIFVLDTNDDAFEITNSVAVADAGCGPRHGAFYPPGAEKATHYYVVCEVLNTVLSYALEYENNTMKFLPFESNPTLGPDPPVTNGLGPSLGANQTSSRAAELIISADGKSLYVSNRLTGGEEDSIAHFTIGNFGSLRLNGVSRAGGKLPRMMSLNKPQPANPQINQPPRGCRGGTTSRSSSVLRPATSVPGTSTRTSSGVPAVTTAASIERRQSDSVQQGQDTLFVANMKGDSAIVAFRLLSDGGILPLPLALLGFETIAEEGSDLGPQFVTEIVL